MVSSMLLCLLTGVHHVWCFCLLEKAWLWPVRLLSVVSFAYFLAGSMLFSRYLGACLLLSTAIPWNACRQWLVILRRNFVVVQTALETMRNIYEDAVLSQIHEDHSTIFSSKNTGAHVQRLRLLAKAWLRCLRRLFDVCSTFLRLLTGVHLPHAFGKFYGIM